MPPYALSAFEVAVRGDAWKPSDAKGPAEAHVTRSRWKTKS